MFPYIEQVPTEFLPRATLLSRDTRTIRWSQGTGSYGGIIAHINGRVVGLLNYGLETFSMHCAIAWVHPSFRHKNLMKLMFSLAIELEQPNHIFANSVTKKGYALIRWLAATYPTITVHDHGDGTPHKRHLTHLHAL